MAKRKMPKDDRLFTFKVSLLSGRVTEESVRENEEISRTIETRGDHTLEDFHWAIFDAFGRYDQHLYEFQVGGKKPQDRRARRYTAPEGLDGLFGDDDAADAGRTAVGSIGLKPHDVFFYWFDFGDDWWHRVELLAVAANAPGMKLPRLTGSVGESPPQYPDFDEDDSDDDEDDDEGGPTLEDIRAMVPGELLDRFDEIIALTDRFCDAHFGDEYKDLCREMAAAVCQPGSPVLEGGVSDWAVGIVTILGQINALWDSPETPDLSAEEVVRGFGVSLDTAQSKAREIFEGLQLVLHDPVWTLPSRLDASQLIWMFQDQDGLVFDVRRAPREVQEEAFRRGLIPFIPADRPPEGTDGAGWAPRLV